MAVNFISKSTLESFDEAVELKHATPCKFTNATILPQRVRSTSKSSVLWVLDGPNCNLNISDQMDTVSKAEVTLTEGLVKRYLSNLTYVTPIWVEQ